MTMTAEERAQEYVGDFCSGSDLYYKITALADVIRAAENDALERAAAVAHCYHPMNDGGEAAKAAQNIAAAIRALKQETRG